MKPISVTELNNQIKSIIEPHFEIVLVEGEVSKATYHSSGHLYFTIKDENSSIDCAMWRSNLAKLKFKIKPGDKLLIYGAISLYVPRGEYKLIAQNIEPSGIGALQKAYEELKEELKKLGYFDEKYKKPIPKFPKKIAIITSSTAAALQDMLRIANKRWRLTKFYLFDTLVQGESAAKNIAENIYLADNFVFSDGSKFDLIIVGRGGGSKEDLWPFNERVVADAIFKAKTPIISAVGHEIDYLISDFVADKRAATPSNAIEIALPDSNEILLMIDEMINHFDFKMKSIIDKKEKLLNHLFEIYRANSIENKLNLKLSEIENLKRNFEVVFNSLLNQKINLIESLKNEFLLNSPIKKIENSKKEVEFLKENFNNMLKSILINKESEISALKNAFKSVNPKLKEKKGFAEVVKNGKRVSLKEIKTDDIFYIQDSTTKIKVKALRKEEDVL